MENIINTTHIWPSDVGVAPAVWLMFSRVSVVDIHYPSWILWSPSQLLGNFHVPARAPAPFIQQLERGSCCAVQYFSSEQTTECSL